MVLTGGAEERVMAMGPERSKHLHNFKMPTPWLTWGNQKFLRCMKLKSSTANANAFDNHHHHRSSGSRSFAASEIDYHLGSKRNRDFGFDFEQRSPKNANSSARRLNIGNNRYIGADDEDEGIEAVREKLTFDLKTAADNMKFSILKEGGDEDEDVEGEEEPSAAAAAAVEAADRPWNLRTRRAACKAPIVNGKNSTKFDERKAASVSPLRTENPMKSSRLRVGGGGSNGGEKKERAKFSVLLSRKEIEEDYLEMIGERPPRRPKKRPKAVQKQMDTLFPGLWLTEVTPDMYKVAELPDSGKR